MNTTSTLALNNGANATLGIFQQIGVPLVAIFFIIFLSVWIMRVMAQGTGGLIKRAGRIITRKK